MKKHVLFIEVEGGSDKGPDGHRKDTMPMVEALKKKGWEAEDKQTHDLTVGVLV